MGIEFVRLYQRHARLWLARQDGARKKHARCRHRKKPAAGLHQKTEKLCFSHCMSEKIDTLFQHTRGCRCCKRCTCLVGEKGIDDGDDRLVESGGRDSKRGKKMSAISCSPRPFYFLFSLTSSATSDGPANRHSVVRKANRGRRVVGLGRDVGPTLFFFCLSSAPF